MKKSFPFKPNAPQPSNLRFCLMIQIITGVTLAMHYNPTSAFFFLVYLHIGRGLYYGTVIFILMMATAFLGYVLPYGQMMGQDIVEFLFFALHFVLPFVLAALVLMHLIVLHDNAGSSNPLGVSSNYDKLPFAPYFIFKDLITIFLFIIVLSVFVFFMPNVLGDSVIAMFSAILILLTMPYTDLGKTRGLQFRPLSKGAFYIFISNFLVLMVLGAKHVETPFIELGQLCTVLYFSHFLFIVPVISMLENTLIDINSKTDTDKIVPSKLINLTKLKDNLLNMYKHEILILGNKTPTSTTVIELAQLQEGAADSQTNLNSEVRMLKILTREEGVTIASEPISLKRGIDQLDPQSSTSSKR
ncbi:hypothetical protein DFH28DRAFT_1170166 [Melampsora americana]|nr:hypothetical protein DFH28DRAFT_1170166 [Melampsora americana]